jgi:calpain-15
MMDLTGCPTECIEFEDSESAYQIENGDFFNKMRLYDEAGYLISGTTPGEDHMTEARGEGEDKGKEEGEGLIYGHAYSIIKVISCQGHQLLKIRNPWGNFEWQGDWCDKD